MEEDDDYIERGSDEWNTLRDMIKSGTIKVSEIEVYFKIRDEDLEYLERMLHL